MTQEEQDAVLGRTLREYGGSRKELAAMAAQLGETGAMLSRLGGQLKQRPEALLFEGVEHNSRFGDPRAEIFFPNTIDGKSIAADVSALQQQHIKVQELANRLRALGQDPDKIG